MARFSFLFLFFCLTLGGLACATTPLELDSLAERLAPEIDKASVKSLAVVNFTAADEQLTDLGWCLANKLSDSIVLKSPATVIVDRTRLEITVVTSPSYSLSEPAVEGASEWKLRPAPGQDAKPTTVIVPIDVTFQPLRT